MSDDGTAVDNPGLPNPIFYANPNIEIMQKKVATNPINPDVLEEINDKLTLVLEALGVDYRSASDEN